MVNVLPLPQTLHKHSLFVHVVKPDRTDDLVQSPFLRPIHHLLKQSLRDFKIVNDIEAAETHLAEIFLFVIGMVD